MTLDDLERLKRTLAEKIVLWRPLEKFELSAVKCRSSLNAILVSRNIYVYRLSLWIFAAWFYSGYVSICQTTVGLTKSVIFVVCYWSYVWKLWTG